jgi:hypothetical protein
MNLQMDPLTTCPIQTGSEVTIEQYTDSLFRCIDNPERQFAQGLVLTSTRTRSDGSEQLLILTIHKQIPFHFLVFN